MTKVPSWIAVEPPLTVAVESVGVESMVILPLVEISVSYDEFTGIVVVALRPLLPEVPRDGPFGSAKSPL